MSQKISLKEAERKAFRLAHQDGLWDIFIACVTLMFAIGPFLSPRLGDFWSSAIFLPFWGLAFLVIWLVRKYVIRPRIGQVKFRPARISRLRRSYLVIFVILLANFILGLFSAISFVSLPGGLSMTIFSLLILTVFSIAGYFLEFNELYIYGLLIAFSPLVGEWLYTNFKVSHHGYPVTFGITTGIIMITGLVKFIRILRADSTHIAGTLSGEA